MERFEKMEDYPESSPVSTLGPMTASAALERMFEKSVPEEYADCRAEDVPELSRFIPDAGRGVCFRGETGIGKTYAATALARKIVSGIFPSTNQVTGEVYYPSGTILWESSPYLLARIRSTFWRGAKESEIDIINECLAARVMVLDDLGAEKTTEFTGATLYTIISGRRNHRSQTIVTTNQSLEEINEWEPRIASRLAEMQSVNLPNCDRRIAK